MSWLLFFLIASFADEEPPATLRGWYAYQAGVRAGVAAPCRRVDRKLNARLKKLDCKRQLERPDPCVVCRDDNHDSLVWFAFTTKDACDADSRR
jgi:hypothetical protein